MKIYIELASAERQVDEQRKDECDDFDIYWSKYNKNVHNDWV